MASLETEDLLIEVERFKALLTAFATGGSAEDEDYRVMRERLLDQPRIGGRLPTFVRLCRNLSEFWPYIKGKFPTYAERRSYLRDEFDPLLTWLEQESRAPSDDNVSTLLASAGYEYVHETWQKALERRASDPEAAMTTARTLLESVCKHILDDEAVAYSEKDDLPKLYGLTAKQLNLAPSQHTEQLFKQILGACVTVVEGLGAARNRLSDAHGSGKLPVRPSARHAELAVNLAGSVASFLIQRGMTADAGTTRNLPLRQ